MFRKFIVMVVALVLSLSVVLPTSAQDNESVFYYYESPIQTIFVGVLPDAANFPMQGSAPLDLITELEQDGFSDFAEVDTTIPYAEQSRVFIGSVLVSGTPVPVAVVFAIVGDNLYVIVGVSDNSLFYQLVSDTLEENEIQLAPDGMVRTKVEDEEGQL